MAIRSPHQNALRLLYIFVEGSTPLPSDDVSGAKAIFKGETRLHAFDFWMRYPDYLADELLNLYDSTRNETLLSSVKAIFDADEPDIRRFPMIRWRFGAYEPLDDTLAILRSHNLIKFTGRKAGNKVLETDYLVMPAAFTLAEGIIADFPALNWYPKRAALVAYLAGARGGSSLKEQQHQQFEYHEAKMGGSIPAITDRVRERLNAVCGD